MGLHRFVVKILLLALACTLSVTAYGQTTTGTDAHGFVYSATSGVITITGYTGSGGAVSIPATIVGVSGTVTSIEYGAFQNCTGLTSVGVK